MFKDRRIKIWEENDNNGYELIKILDKHKKSVCSISSQEDKNKCIYSGIDGTRIWDFYHENNIKKNL